MTTRTPLYAKDADAARAFFGAVFTASEGPGEGAAVGDLAGRLLVGTPPADLRGHALRASNGTLLAAVLWSRLRFADDPRAVFLLSPMAVAPNRQGQGLGSALIRDGLAALRAEGVFGVVTYGDPAFYGRLGFRPLDDTAVPSPLPLSMPQGWIGQTVEGTPLTALPGPSRAVAAFDDPGLW